MQDSERRRFQVAKENFFPVPLGRNRKEIATQWFHDLAGSKPLALLAKKVRGVTYVCMEVGRGGGEKPLVLLARGGYICMYGGGEGRGREAFGSLG